METLRTTFFEADDGALREATCFAASFTLCLGTPHVCILNSRMALYAMPWAALSAAIALACVTCLGRRPLAQRRACAMASLSIYIVAAGVFALTHQLQTQTAAFVVLTTAAVTATTCDACRLNQLDARHAALALSFGGGAGAAFALVVMGALTSLGVNAAVYSLLEIAALIILALAGLVAHAFAQLVQPPADTPRSVGRPPSDIANNVRLTETDLLEAGSDEPGPTTTGSTVATTLLAVCAGGAAAAFFDGFSYNPMIRNVEAIELLRGALVLTGALSLLAGVSRSESDQVTRATIPAGIVFLGMGIVGMVALSLDSPVSEALGSAATSAAHGLMALAGIALSAELADRHPRRACLCAGAVLACCESPVFAALGFWAKHMVGYDIRTLTPLVIGAVALLALMSLMANMHVMNSMRVMREAYAHRLAERTSENAEARRARILDNAISGIAVSPREREVALWAMTGLSNKDVGAKVGIAEKTVSYHLGNFYKKTKIEGKAELIRLGRDGGLANE